MKRIFDEVFPDWEEEIEVLMLQDQQEREEDVRRILLCPENTIVSLFKEKIL